MKVRTSLSLVAGAALLVSACADTLVPPLAPDGTGPSAAVQASQDAGRYVILMGANTIPADLAARVEAAGGQVVKTFPAVGIAIATSSNSGFAASVAGDSRVQSVGPVPAFAVPGRVAGSRLSAVPSSHPTPPSAFFAQGLLWGIERVNAPAAWHAGHTGEGAVIAILDTGIASNHPDLAPNLEFNACFTSAGSHIGDWVPGAPCIPYPSLSEHGTHVAGTAAAAFGFGVVGVAPNARLANYNIFELIPDCGVCSFSDVRWEAMLDAAARGVDVINMSLGGFTFIGNRFRDEPVRQDGLATFLAAEKRVAGQVTRQGVTLVSSAGNEGTNLNGVWVATPGQTPGHITVGGTGIQPNPRYEPGISFDIRAFYSNFGAAIDVVAPGGDCGLVDSCDPATRPPNWFEHLILSADVWPLTEACAQAQNCSTGWLWLGGTSMAAPHVSGVAALMRAADPSLRPNQLISRIRGTADDLGDRQQFGHGMVDALAAASN